MTAPLPLLSEDEVRSVVYADEDRSFGCMRCPQGNLPLKALRIGARIVGTFAHTTLTQTFVNNAGVPVEATYIFPLPDRAAVTRFVMEVAGRRVEGDLQERHQARQTYDRAIAQGKRASIAEEERPGTFTLRVGNLMPGEEASIILELTGPLPVADGEVTYRFPLVVAPRYIPGRPLSGDQVGDGVGRDTDAVPDASRISPPVLLKGYPNPVQLGIDVTIDAAGLPLSRVRSALHAAWADESQGLLRVQINPGERLDRDFILRFHLGDAQLRTTARATRLNDGKDDALLITLVPPSLSSTTTRARDIVFVLDRSGSMGGWKMIAARRAVARMVDTLRSADRFSLLAFDDRVEAFGHGLTEAGDRSRFQAVEWLSKVDARGGTEMAMPLSQAADLLAGGHLERDRVLVFVTDGQVGNEAQLLKLLGNRLRGTRVFALGIDQAVNAGFLNRLSQLGGQGDAELVESEDRLDEVLTRCHRRIDTPVLADVTVDLEGATLIGGTLAPQRLPDVFAGVPAVIAGRLRRSGSSKPTLIVRGRLGNGSTFNERIVVETTANPALLPAWARLHLRDLEDQFDGGKGNKAELERRIVQVSLEARVLCRFTAFVAVDHDVVNPGGRLHHTTQAVESPAGWEGGGGVPPPFMPTGAPAPARRMAVREEQSMRSRAAPISAPLDGGDDDLMGAADALADESDSFDDDVDSVIAPAARSMAMPSAPPPRSAPPPPPSSKSVAAGGLLGSLVNKVVDKMSPRRDEAEKKEAARPLAVEKERVVSTGAVGSLEPYADRLRALLDRLAAGEDSHVVADDLALLIEEAAHAGIAPVTRKPLEEALRCLLQGDVDGARRLLEPLAKPARAGFWR